MLSSLPQVEILVPNVTVLEVEPLRVRKVETLRRDHIKRASEGFSSLSCEDPVRRHQSADMLLPDFQPSG